MVKKATHEKRFNFRKFKICLLCSVIVLLFVTIILRLFMIQVGKRDFYISKLNKQYELTYSNADTFRGEIYDRNGVELATSILTFSVYINKSKVGNIKTFSSKINEITGLPVKYIREKLSDGSSKGFFLLRKVEDSTLKNRLLTLKKENIKGLSDAFEVIEESKRFYPYKELASHVLGFVNPDNEGLEGIEFFYDKKIRGNITKASYNGDLPEGFFRKGKPIREGNSIELTIDKDIQAVAEEELKKGIFKSKAKSGFIVIMDPNNGEILAMASYPFYDPNDYNRYSSWARRNRAIIDLYEPGSVMKVFIISSAIEERLVSPRTKVNCENGKYKVHDRVFKEAHHKQYGALTVEEVLKYSSNIGSIKIGEKIGKKKLYEYLKNFGFGEKTNIGFPGEVRGIVPSVKELTPVRISTISFGQGIALTPLQIVRGFSAIVNGGYLLKPILIKRILDEDNNTIWTNQKEILKRVISDETSKILKDMLRKAVEEGTGKEANVEGLEVLGKTGTAQKPGKRGYIDEYLASFLGAFPKDNPKYVIFVGVDAPQGIAYGGYVAAPIFHEVAKRIVDLKGEERKVIVVDKKSYNKKEENDILNNPNENKILQKVENSSNIPDFRGLTLREVIRVANLKGINIEVVGSGIAYEQKTIFAGEKSNANKVIVYLR